MTDKNIIATLVARLRCYRHMWNDEDHKAVEDAVEWLRTDTTGWSPNAGGVCDNCGEPGFVHREDGSCPSDRLSSR